MFVAFGGDSGFLGRVYESLDESSFGCDGVAGVLDKLEEVFACEGCFHFLLVCSVEPEFPKLCRGFGCRVIIRRVYGEFGVEVHQVVIRNCSHSNSLQGVKVGGTVSKQEVEYIVVSCWDVYHLLHVEFVCELQKGGKL